MELPPLCSSVKVSDLSYFGTILHNLHYPVKNIVYVVNLIH